MTAWHNQADAGADAGAGRLALMLTAYLAALGRPGLQSSTVVLMSSSPLLLRVESLRFVPCKGSSTPEAWQHRRPLR
jgi:hypothetical protein